MYLSGLSVPSADLVHPPFATCSTVRTLVLYKRNLVTPGRNVSVFGTVPVLASGQQPTKATFTLDDAAALPATTFTAQHHPNATQYYIPMFRSPALTEDKKHKLVVTHVSDRGGQLYFDYMTVQGTLERFAVPESGLSGDAKVAVVGGVLGGVILILLGLVGALLWKNRRAQRVQHFHDGKGVFLPPVCENQR